ncbi:MAG: hypothetical protein AB7V13_15080 [Pseudorhodoplanes sp.]|uniref:hypothetical protein n=1 Tax=Pseudorhodoplanes sp. TaxID=1934341 RepID=UPI003D097076
MTTSKATPQNSQSLVPLMLLVLAGPLIWAAHLLVIYGSTTVICAKAAGAGVLPVIVTATIVALAAIGVLAIRCQRRSDLLGRGPNSHVFLRRVMLLLLALSAVAILWAGSTVLLLPACPSTEHVAHAQQQQSTRFPGPPRLELQSTVLR